MKSNDIQKAVKSNWFGIINRCALFSIFSSLHAIKKQNIPKDAARKALQFTYDHLFHICTFCLQNRQNFDPISFKLSQVDGSVKRILPEPRGNEIYSD